MAIIMHPNIWSMLLPRNMKNNESMTAEPKTVDSKAIMKDIQTSFATNINLCIFVFCCTIVRYAVAISGPTLPSQNKWHFRKHALHIATTVLVLF
jgi:hypothetical protein